MAAVTAVQSQRPRGAVLMAEARMSGKANAWEATPGTVPWRRAPGGLQVESADSKGVEALTATQRQHWDPAFILCLVPASGQVLGWGNPLRVNSESLNADNASSNTTARQTK
ncbi:hypothetical protein P7K49_036946 [Saguinus oedipus]|uniref:Uncharacterized protein n=1 Tax=Saguinus oedipus TaxID=9490 RepID=A0ABQ9TLN2_SAGOE|nr:hypothetical protein P7K49_036946 [Saguinus oedipus]